MKKNLRKIKPNYLVASYLMHLKSIGVKTITYGELARIFNTWAKAMGTMIKAIANRGQTDLSAMVVFA